MKNQVFDPYLPSWEYIPDGEPHAFGGRAYVYGSHDRFNAPIFCMNDYVCWSAPGEDLSDWRYEGVIYRKNQDPKNKLGLRLLFAPDVCRGPDGRYYDFSGVRSITVVLSGTGKGTMEISTAADFSRISARIPVGLNGKGRFRAVCSIPDGVHPLYFRFAGGGAVNFHSFELEAQA